MVFILMGSRGGTHRIILGPLQTTIPERLNFGLLVACSLLVARNGSPPQDPNKIIYTKLLQQLDDPQG